MSTKLVNPFFNGFVTTDDAGDFLVAEFQLCQATFKALVAKVFFF